MTAPDHLRITGPEDILGFIPHSLGYWPASSLVAMTMQGKRLGATLRVDLPNPDGPRGPGSAGPAVFARSVVSYLEADDEADGSLLAFFTDSGTGIGTGADADPDGTAWAELLAELEPALAAAGMPVRDAWLVGADYWRNAYCLDPSCCAPPGRPVDEIRNSPLNAEMVFRGSTVGAAPGTDDLTAAAPVDPAVLEAQRDWAELFSARARDQAQFAQVLDVWTRVLDAASPLPKLPAALTGYLRASLCLLPWRDAVLVMAAAGPEAAERGAEEFGVFDAGAPAAGVPGAGRGGSLPESVPGTPAPVPLPPLDGFPPAEPRRRGAGRGSAFVKQAPPEVAGYGQVLLGLAPPVPDWHRMASLERILEQLGTAGGEAGTAALTGRGWIEWCRGKGSYAHALFSRAGEEHPGYRLAALLDELASRGTLCGWAGRRETAWQRFNPDVA
ncbi:hypothetical protein NicSoilB4_14120 [Arthrobacter sp. NicSoilB4]|uniref:DUF4192 family protein n=1 Tax=Arthrobacter sp. NicSoilB4 TaxID=2830997 RepID=UPI001CC7C544|nr:DUF4192 family protein [Arthrobacter sp. NicSoilB4]BCW66649.1 hypothetical protein NicSoilB4_14120 [Arthrobacter sp. NicSoilB4]